MLAKGKEASRFGVLSLAKMANSDSESSMYDEDIDFQLDAQPSAVAYQGEPLAVDSDTSNEENGDVDDPDGLLPDTLEPRFEMQIQVQEW